MTRNFVEPDLFTDHLAALMTAGDASDPIAAQFVATAAEAVFRPEECADPIGDGAHSPVKGVVHRYPDRVLLTPHFTCPAYCRFCFRRNRVGQPGTALSPAELDAALAYIRDHEEVWEVILSGGDPLMMTPDRLGFLMDALDAMAHVEVLRIHTRMPVSDPGRITPETVDTLRRRRAAVYVVLHANHPRELGPETIEVCRTIQEAGVPMLAQSVLLKGVNDDPATLGTLMRTLVRHRIKPYYLHHCDLAPGTGHFRTSLEAGQALMRSLRGELSGLCQPVYVLDIPGGHGKVPVGPCYLGPDGAGGVTVEDPSGHRHRYPPETPP
ncbi:MAG: lysine-2,3-aminomutase-like protein [Alphaproteobacteria bacterium]